MKKSLVLRVLVMIICSAGCLDEPYTTPQPTGEDYNEIDTAHEPIQEPYSGREIHVNAHGFQYTLAPVATYTASVLVVSTRQYHDADAGLVPVDLCVVWGTLAEPEYLQYATFSQKDRECIITYDAESPVDTSFILHQFVNIHVIPANQSILQSIKTIKTGQKIILKGFLVDIYLNGTIYIKSSTTLTDEGSGACEILYVTDVESGIGHA
jgi:hypothetical protein